MIFVTQGHQKGIGLEVFFKSLLLISPNHFDKFILVCVKQDVEQVLQDLSISFQIQTNFLTFGHVTIRCLFIDKGNKYSSTQLTLNKALEKCNSNTVLVTLPTSKDQFSYKNEPANGYTEYLRKFFNINELAMTFVAPNHKVLLLSDHIPLRQVTQLDYSSIIKKISFCIEFYKRLEPLKEIYISGINPHSGENGLLGDEDIIIEKAVHTLRKENSLIEFHGPLSGDTLHLYQNPLKSQLFVYAFHDQGLPYFKGSNGMIGVNQTLGLPFVRLSVDHGTAFELYAKNKADYMGCFYLLHYALTINKEIANIDE